jgi:CBS domain-containing protein
MSSVRDLLQKKTAKVITVTPETSAGTVARLLMIHNIGGVPVVPSGGRPVGFIAERDLVKAIDASPEDIRPVPVERLMRRPVPVCSADDSLRDVMARMTRDRLRHLVVLDGDSVTSVISVGDLVKHRLEQLETETGVLRDYVAAYRAST